MKLVKKFFTYLITQFWWRLPIKRENRKRIKDFFFSKFGFLISNTTMYKSWVELNNLSKITTSEYDIDYPSHWPKPLRTEGFIDKLPEISITSKNRIESIAIVIHAYYPDIFTEVIKQLDKNSQKSFKLFVTCPSNQHGDVKKILSNSPFEFELLVVENRGRDILPFLKISQIAIEQGFGLLLKIHTKKSDHRMTGHLWRSEIFSALLPPKAREKTIEIFNENPSVGILGPVGHIVPMNLYFGINAKAIGYLCRHLNVSPSVLSNLFFVAGSMFYIRSEALEPLLMLNLPHEVFEEEAGQRDGTMAHAFERAFSVSAFAKGMIVVSSNSTPNNLDSTSVVDHRFTW
jgi:lipopolysaccharide biosynthesis protein